MSSLHAAQSLLGLVARAEGYTYTAKVWSSCFVQGPFSSRRASNPNRPMRNFLVSKWS
jgi:hypothetical protein